MSTPIEALAVRSRLLFVCAAAACSTPSSTAHQVCAQLVEAGVASRCTDESNPREVSVRFDLVGNGSHGLVYADGDDDAYQRALQHEREIDDLFDDHDQRPHRFHHEGRRVRIMLVHGADPDAQRAAERVVNGL